MYALSIQTQFIVLLNSTCNTSNDSQVYSRLNHLSVTLSYCAVLKLVTKISKLHKRPIEAWISEGACFKFVGDNVAKKKGVRDIRSDHHGELVQMYSLLAVKGRVKGPSPVSTFSPLNLDSLKVTHFLPTMSDIEAIQDNLVVLVSRVLCEYIKPLQRYKRSVASHINHTHSKEMATKSDVIVLDVLHKNETKAADMIDIMIEEQSYLGDSFEYTVMSGGDQVTCERQRCSKKHMLDSDTRSGRLEQIEPCVEDWHCLMSILGVGSKI